MDYLIRGLDGLFPLAGPFSTVPELKRAICAVTCIPEPLQSLSSGGRRLQQCLPAAGSCIQVHLLVAGGKGGFGANLRAQGRTATTRTATTFKYCRDLNGRRLQAVNDEARLRAWLSKEEVAKRAAAAAGGLEYSEPSGPSGLEGWQLSVPNWAEGVGGKVSAWQRPKKTELCREWLQARAQRGGAPAGAPRCWGCPRGRGCGYAHGEEELRGEGKLAAAAASRELAERIAKERLSR